MDKHITILVIAAVLSLMLIGTATAAVIRGTVYDLDLEVQKDALVEIDTKPNQMLIAKDGTYSFTVPSGAYTLSASYILKNITYSYAYSTVEIEQEGEYIIDLILLPNLDEEEEILREAEEEIDFEEDRNIVPYAIAVLIIAIAVYILLRKRKKVKSETKIAEDNKTEQTIKGEIGELDEIIEFIKKEGGRTTQKDIRQNFPQSEAKISLVIAELEDKGLIRKIKKGRGNIIILN